MDLQKQIKFAMASFGLVVTLTGCFKSTSSSPVQIPEEKPVQGGSQVEKPVDGKGEQADRTPGSENEAEVAGTSTVEDSSAEESTALPSLAMALNIARARSFKHFDAPVQSQFGGTCSAFATAAAMNNILKRKGISKEVSERHLWSTYARYDALYAVEAASENYLTEQQYWPTYGQRAENFKDFASLRITQSELHEYNMESALQGLNRGNPLVMAVQVPSDLANCRAEVRSTSAYTRGQHVVTATGYVLDDAIPGGGYFLIKNS